MKMKILVATVLSLSAVLVLGALGCRTVAAKAVREVPRMAPDELKARLDDPSLVILDVRVAGDWDDSKAKIKGAIREVSDKVTDWVAKYDKEKTYVLYCA